MGRIILDFANASCAHCARLVTRSLGKVDGILSVEVDRISHQLFVDFDPARVSVESIRLLLERSGYSNQLVAATVTAPSYPQLSVRGA